LKHQESASETGDGDDVQATVSVHVSNIGVIEAIEVPGYAPGILDPGGAAIAAEDENAFAVIGDDKVKPAVSVQIGQARADAAGAPRLILQALGGLGPASQAIAEEDLRPVGLAGDGGDVVQTVTVDVSHGGVRPPLAFLGQPGRGRSEGRTAGSRRHIFRWGRNVSLATSCGQKGGGGDQKW
jgi:hypothetical protein